MPDDKDRNKVPHWEQLETVDIPDVPEELRKAWAKAIASAAPPPKTNPTTEVEARLTKIEGLLNEVLDILKKKN